MTYNHQRTPTYFGNVSPCMVDPVTRMKDFSPIDYRLSYINNLPIEVTVEWRSGLKVTLPPQPSMTSNKLIARVEINIHPSVKFDIQRLLSVVNESASLELQAMRSAFEIQIQNNSYGGALLVLDYTLSLEQIKRYGGTVYYNELDVVLSILPFDEVQPHPYGMAGRNSQIIDGSIVSQGKKGFGYAVDIIDNFGKYGDRYINIANKVYRIDRRKDLSKCDGIYVTTHSSVEGELGMNEIVTNHYDFDVAEEALSLYKSAEEARSFGDGSLARKHEITQLEHEITLHKGELQSAKQQHELDMIKKDKEVKLLEMERETHSREIAAMRERTEHELSVERQRIKDMYDARSHERKDNSESIKFLPGLIVGLGAMFMAIKTLM